jgi:signal transduction histidine kinase
MRVIFGFITLYVLASFAWLMFSLFRYNEEGFEKTIRILEVGQNGCVLSTIAQANNDRLTGPQTDTVYLKQLELVVDTAVLKQFVETEYKKQYIATFSQANDQTYLAIEINPVFIDEAKSLKQKQQILLWIQGILLFSFVATGIFGIIFTVRNAYKLSRQQNNFLLSVTHELKTPIASVRLMLQTLASRKLPEEKQKQLVETAIGATVRLEELTENMLTATQIENKYYNYGFEEIDLHDLLSYIINNFKLKGDIEGDLEEDVWVTGDNFVLRIALNNIIDNAFKYSDGKPVEVTLEKTKKKAIIQIKDNGVGIDPKHRKRIFKRFFRVQDEETRTTKGTGLGLFIVKEVIEKHDGQISVGDNQPHGTIFTISLPLNKS